MTKAQLEDRVSELETAVSIMESNLSSAVQAQQIAETNLRAERGKNFNLQEVLKDLLVGKGD